MVVIAVSISNIAVGVFVTAVFTSSAVHRHVIGLLNIYHDLLCCLSRTWVLKESKVGKLAQARFIIAMCRE